jgi:hypothetical protein
MGTPLGLRLGVKKKLIDAELRDQLRYVAMCVKNVLHGSRQSAYAAHPPLIRTTACIIETRRTTTPGAQARLHFPKSRGITHNLRPYAYAFFGARKASTHWKGKS